MSLNPFRIRCLKTILLSRTQSESLLRISFRYSKDKRIKDFESNNENDLSKTRIILKDQKGNIMGNKLLSEAKLLAQKLNLNLMEDKSDLTHFKYKSFKLVSNQDLVQIDKHFDEIHNESDSKDSKDLSNSVSTQTHKEVKHLMFSTKLNENDLMTKINQIKRWLLRGHQITVNVMNSMNDTKVLDEIYNKFETELKGFAKFNQKKIKSNNTLKFTIVSAIDTKEQMKNIKNSNEDLDLQNMDPNKLLSDDFEKQL